MAKVTLLSYTPEPEKVVAAAAKLCYSSAGIPEITQGLTEESTASFVRMIAELGHASTLEHVSFTFGIEGVSRSFLAQMTRHRIASYSVKSQRYVGESEFSYVIPPEIEAIPEAKEEFTAAMEEDRRHYSRLAALLAEKHQRDLMRDGETDEKAALRKRCPGKMHALSFPMPVKPRWSARSTQESFSTFSRFAAATALSGKSAVLQTKCWALFGKLPRIFSATRDPRASAVPARKEKCPAAGRKLSANITGKQEKRIHERKTNPFGRPRRKRKNHPDGTFGKGIDPTRDPAAAGEISGI